jgi:hypothetical protein
MKNFPQSKRTRVWRLKKEARKLLHGKRVPFPDDSASWPEWVDKEDTLGPVLAATPVYKKRHCSIKRMGGRL